MINMTDIVTPLCVKPWTHLYLDNNICTACCWAKSAHVDLDENSTYDNMWNSAHMQEFRHDMLESSKEGKLPKHCRDYCDMCVTIESNIVTDDIRKSIKSELTYIETAPSMVDATVTQNCNLRCKMCWVFDRIGEELNYNALKTLLQETFKRNPKFTLGLVGGEVFFDPKSRDFIEWCGNYNINIGFTTNLNVYDEKLLNNIKLNNLQGFTFSCDGGTSDTYNEIRQGNWNVLHSNLHKACKLTYDRSLQGERRCIIYMNSIIMRSTYDEITDAIEAFYKYPIIMRFGPISDRYRDDSYEQVFHTIHEIPKLRYSIKKAITLINSKIDTIDDWHKDYENDYQYVNNKIDHLNITKTSLIDSLDYLEYVLTNNQDRLLTNPILDYKVDVQTKKVTQYHHINE